VADYRDDWEKPRGPGTKLTAAEISRLKVAFNTNTHSRDIARELQCSSRIANKYYAMFRGYTPVVRRVRPKVVVRPAPEPKLERKSRFYTSNFELEG
jgi:hypothetical protein